MNTQQLWHPSRSVIALLLLLTYGFASSVSATDNPPAHKYTAILIWGTDGPKPEDKEFKDLDKALLKKFHVFKWKNYFEVNRKDFNLKKGDAKHVELSDKCEVKLHLTQNEELEVELFGEKKSVYKGKQSMPLNDDLILGGDAKNATAWFVVLKPHKDKDK